ncbi:hypothetical protein ABW636_05930 [Aquimarina sp. 2201CG1-2-11]|uniref:hypothetical protein n=1 Tax=Aquimarina discodermiae TaxID=3231043 RepID=UPI0034632F90
MEIKIKLPIWFWVVGILALVWNLIGVNAYIAQAYITPDALTALTEGEQSYYTNSPSCVTASFASALGAS